MENPTGKNNQKQTLVGVIILLLLAGGGIYYALISFGILGQYLPFWNKMPTNSRSTQSVPYRSNPAYSSQRNPAHPLTPNEKKNALAFPSSDAEERLKERHNNLLRILAVNVPSLDISGCNPNPFVAEVKLGSGITLENNDIAVHTITPQSLPSFDIPALGKKTFNASDVFTHTGGYAYRCDTNAEPVGVFFVVQ